MLRIVVNVITEWFRSYYKLIEASFQKDKGPFMALHIQSSIIKCIAWIFVKHTFTSFIADPQNKQKIW